ncbi:hypothetical protein Q4595_04710 [Wenyingzhuangia sp. 1_MG-2023]|nr:hypothetical protein [Wenyingzhuangia sp. 1_MG-2023]
MIDKYTGINSYKKLVEEFETATFKPTAEKVLFMGVVFGMSQKMILKKLGNPSLIHIVSKKEEIYVLSYTLKIMKKRAKADFHFFRNKLFYVNVNFYNQEINSIEDVLKILKIKYGNFLSSGKTFFKNNLNNSIGIDVNLGLSLNYYSMCSNFHEKFNVLRKREEQKSIKEKDKQSKILFENL